MESTKTTSARAECFGTSGLEMSWGPDALRVAAWPLKALSPRTLATGRGKWADGPSVTSERLGGESARLISRDER